MDDEPYNLLGLRIIINAAIKDDGVDELIDQAQNGLEALQAVENARDFQYGLIFMDCSMPVMDGYEATRSIRALRDIQQPMIVACTGHSEPEYIKKAYRHEMDELVEKPANVQVIKAILKEIIQFNK